MKQVIFLALIAAIVAGAGGCCWPWGCRDGRGGYHDHDRGDWHHDR